VIIAEADRSWPVPSQMSSNNAVLPLGSKFSGSGFSLDFVQFRLCRKSALLHAERYSQFPSGVLTYRRPRFFRVDRPSTQRAMRGFSGTRAAWQVNLCQGAESAVEQSLRRSNPGEITAKLNHFACSLLMRDMGPCFHPQKTRQHHHPAGWTTFPIRFCSSIFLGDARRIV
jgi:hypothetical protein